MNLLYYPTAINDEHVGFVNSSVTESGDEEARVPGDVYSHLLGEDTRKDMFVYVCLN